MTDVYCICGFVGAGKTTYAKGLAHQTRAFRFTMDEWMIPLFGEHMDREDFDDRRSVLEGLFQDSALQLTKLAVPVIFDFGFWSRGSRLAIRRWASERNLQCQMHYVHTPFAICRQRAIERNKVIGPTTYQMTEEMLELFWSWFEEPTSSEDVVRISGL